MSEEKLLSYECSICGYRNVKKQAVNEHIQDNEEDEHDTVGNVTEHIKEIRRSADPDRQATYTVGYSCTECQYVGDAKSDAIQHARDKEDEHHQEQSPDEMVREITATVNRKTFEAVYVINKKAKQFAERGTRYYRQGRKGDAKIASEKKESLYGTKTEILSKIHRHCESIERHKINGNKFHCMYFTDEFGETWSYHTPVKEISIPNSRMSENVERDLKEISDFSKSANITRSEMDLAEALEYLKNEHCISANQHIPQTRVEYGLPSFHKTSSFRGWECL